MSRESIGTANSTAMVVNQVTAGQSLLHTQPVAVQHRRALNVKSPAEKRRSNLPSSLTRRFNALDSGTRATINESFLFNVRAGKV